MKRLAFAVALVLFVAGFVALSNHGDMTASPTRGRLGTPVTITLASPSSGREFNSSTVMSWTGTYDPYFSSATTPFTINWSASEVEILDPAHAVIIIGSGSSPDAPNVDALKGFGRFAGTATLTTTINPPCPGDMNGDRRVNMPDLAILIANWGACDAPCVGDLDSNGVVDSADLSNLLSAFSSCPQSSVFEVVQPFKFRLTADPTQWNTVYYPDGPGGLDPPELGTRRADVDMMLLSILPSPIPEVDTMMFAAHNFHMIAVVLMDENAHTLRAAPATIVVDFVSLTAAGKELDRISNVTLTRIDDDHDRKNITYASDFERPVMVVDIPLDPDMYPDLMILYGEPIGSAVIAPSLTQQPRPMTPYLSEKFTAELASQGIKTSWLAAAPAPMEDEQQNRSVIEKLAAFRLGGGRKNLNRLLKSFQEQAAAEPYTTWLEAKPVLESPDVLTVVKSTMFNAVLETADTPTVKAIVAAGAQWCNWSDKSKQLQFQSNKPTLLCGPLLTKMVANKNWRTWAAPEPTLITLLVNSSVTQVADILSDIALDSDVKSGVAEGIILRSSRGGFGNGNGLFSFLNDDSISRIREALRLSIQRDGLIHFGAVGALVEIGDLATLPIVSNQAAISASLPKQEMYDSKLQQQRSDFRAAQMTKWWIAKIKVQHPPSQLLQWLTDPERATPQRYGEALWAMRRAVELGIDPERIRLAVLQFAENIRQKEAMASVLLYQVKREALEAGVLRPDDLEDVVEPPQHGYIMD